MPVTPNNKNFRGFSRRQFARISTATMGGLFMNGASSDNLANPNSANASETKKPDESELSVIGPYGRWAASLTEGRLPAFSYRRESWQDMISWRETAQQLLTERLGIPHT